MGNECERRQPTGKAKQFLAVWNGWNMVSCNVVHACGRQQTLPSARRAWKQWFSIKRFGRFSDGAQEQKGRDVGKSGVQAVCHGWFVMQACLAPGHPAARAHVAPPPSASSPACSFRSLVKDEYSGEQWARCPEKGEKFIRPPCRLLSHAHPKRGGQLGYLNHCHFHPPLKEVPLNTSKRCA